MNKEVDDNTIINPNDILYVINKHIKYKNAARKSYVRTKILKCDMIDDYTNLPEWAEAKITRAADSLGAVKDHIEYENSKGDM